MDKMISVIIPIYNTKESLLKRCIESVLKQTYKKFEVLLIDDGSAETYLQELEKWTKIDERIKIFSKENGGVSSARNYGMRVAQGEYICFVDSDDTVELNYFESAMGNAKEDIDLMCGKTYGIYPDKITKHDSESADQMRRLYKLDSDFVYKGLINSIITVTTKKYYGIRPEVWAKIYKKSIACQIEFDEDIAIGEDQIFLVEYLKKCHKVMVINTHWYNYYVYKNSAMRKKDEYKVQKYINYYEKMVCCLKEEKWGDEILPEKAKNVLKELVFSYGVERESDFESLKEVFCEYRKLKKNPLINYYIRRLPIKNENISPSDAVLGRFGLTKLGIRLVRFMIYAKIKELKYSKKY